MNGTTAIHGSPSGYTNGCRTRSSCQMGADGPYLSCTEAYIAHARDYTLSKRPPTQRIGRGRQLSNAAIEATPSADHPSAPKPSGPVHGTTWGYRRGCVDSSACPHWVLGKMTCADAKREYSRAYARARRSGQGTPIAHGTIGGYHLGCRAPEACPRSEAGISCHEARRARRSAQVRSDGSASSQLRDSAEVRQVISRALESGLSVREIARLAGVGRSTILRVHTGSDVAKVTARVHDSLTAARAVLLHTT